jgi:hypothetical protein
VLERGTRWPSRGLAPPEFPVEKAKLRPLPVDGAQTSREELQGLVLGILGVAAGLSLCGWLLPGVARINGNGLLVATAVVAAPPSLFSYLEKASSRRRLRLVFGLSGFLWVVAGLAVADWVTPNFDIAGVWEYCALWLVVLSVQIALSAPLLFRRRTLIRQAFLSW